MVCNIVFNSIAEFFRPKGNFAFVNKVFNMAISIAYPLFIQTTVMRTNNIDIIIQGEIIIYIIDVITVIKRDFITVENIVVM